MIMGAPGGLDNSEPAADCEGGSPEESYIHQRDPQRGSKPVSRRAATIYTHNPAFSAG
jgi:hypothetical protein